jgi:hypothetical protein
MFDASTVANNNGAVRPRPATKNALLSRTYRDTHNPIATSPTE